MLPDKQIENTKFVQDVNLAELLTGELFLLLMENYKRWTHFCKYILSA